MLSHLHIENYALIRSLDITLDRGFTVITGETGAGKSILLGALSLILGNRADTSMLYDKTRKCFVEGEFQIGHLRLNSFFEQYNLDYDPVTVLRREIGESGKSRAFINDTPVTLPVLKELAVKLVDIHSQHQNLLLNNAEFRINTLDEFGKSGALLYDYKKAFKAYRDIEKEYGAMVADQARLEEERDYLEYLNEELGKAGLAKGEKEELENRVTLLSHAETIRSSLFHANQLLSEGEYNILHQFNELRKDCGTALSYDSQMEDIVERVERLMAELKDLSFDISRKENDMEINPHQLEEYRQRLDHLYFLEQKHHVRSIEELIGKKEGIAEKLELIAENRVKIEELESRKTELLDHLKETAGSLSRHRMTTSSSFQKEITGKLRLLGMEDARFSIKIEPDNSYSANGSDEVHFYFSANKGMEPEEIAKVASGGELSRLMLAIKSAITASVLLPTVIFDEIDTGISGEIAAKVARIMQDLSQHHQLLAITHLPQIAAKGSLHYYVFKEDAGGKVFTNIRKLNREERIEELAKMMSSEEVTRGAREAATELMNDIHSLSGNDKERRTV